MKITFLVLPCFFTHGFRQTCLSPEILERKYMCYPTLPYIIISCPALFFLFLYFLSCPALPLQIKDTLIRVTSRDSNITDYTNISGMLRLNKCNNFNVVSQMHMVIDCRQKMTSPPTSPGNFADIVYLKEQSFLHRIRDVCTL